ncbi:hypothetical protein BH11ARM2_BH11ARM2_06190 [soil metagenome]
MQYKVKCCLLCSPSRRHRLGCPYPNIRALLVFKNGKPVKNARDGKRRRKEIFEGLDREVVGRTTKRLPKVRWEVTKTESGADDDVPTVTKTLVGHVDNTAYPLDRGRSRLQPAPRRPHERTALADLP